MWHIDGYDKLSPYGIAIHGCIDGFSRIIIWLRASPTNNNPKVVARFYLEALEEIAGVPQFLRSDYGTENCTIAAIHIAFHLKNNSSIGDRTSI
uniref:Integrase core domain-containing protein n=1 Tax=Amphimedon queenslandica TaxID=400682 RepID=A0A1X7VU93_AMPQE